MTEAQGQGRGGVRSIREISPQQAATGALFILGALFLISLMFPIRFRVFGLLFQPYKVLLLVTFIPLGLMLLKGRAGKPMIVDWLMLGSVLWAILALARNHPLGFIVEPSGTYMLEFFGAYMLGRMAIRSGADFRRMVQIFFALLLILLPFAAYEALARDPIAIRLMGQEWMAVYADIRFGMRRAQTVFEHPILYGAFVSAAFGLAWYVLVPTAGTVVRLFLVGLVFMATLFSVSSGALVAINVQIFLILWEIVTRPHPKRWRIFGWMVAIGYVLADMVTYRTPFHTFINYAALNSTSSYNRILIFEFGMQNIKANPIFGIGFRDWARPFWLGSSVDNFWLLIAMQFGLPSLAMVAVAIALIIRRMSRQTLLDPLDRACRAGYLTALGGLIIAGGTVHYWKQLLVFVLFFIGSGVWTFTGGARGAAGQLPEVDPAPGPGRASAPRRGAAADSAPAAPDIAARRPAAPDRRDVPGERSAGRFAR